MHHSDVELRVACVGFHRMIHKNRTDVVEEEETRFICRDGSPGLTEGKGCGVRQRRSPISIKELV
jgi:hypothetical protein